MKCNICKNKIWFFQESLTFKGNGKSHLKCVEDELIKRGVFANAESDKKKPV